MATWAEMSRDSLGAAKSLLGESRFRSSVSRAYYAAYTAIAGVLVERGVRFARGWNNPQHELLPRYVSNSDAFEPATRQQLNRAIRRLRLRREDADYRPRNPVDRAIALECVRDAASVMYLLGVLSEKENG